MKIQNRPFLNCANLCRKWLILYLARLYEFRNMNFYVSHLSGTYGHYSRNISMIRNPATANLFWEIGWSLLASLVVFFFVCMKYVTFVTLISSVDRVY